MAHLETLRTFIAVPLPDEVAQELAAVQRQIRRRAPECVRWVAPSKIHLTLRFLGDVLEERIAPIKEALSVVARHVQPFEIQVKGIGAFPSTHRPSVIWVGVEDASSWLALVQRAVEEAMTHLGFQPETRAFSPHLTLGRVQRGASAQDKRELGASLEATPVGLLGTVTAQEMILFKSTLKPDGAQYTPLARFEF